MRRSVTTIERIDMAVLTAPPPLFVLQAPLVEPWFVGVPDYRHPYLAADTETDQLLEGYGDRLVCCQYSDGSTAILLDAPIPTAHVWLHNARYDLRYLGIDPYDLDRWDCTMLASYILREPSLGLKVVGPKYTEIPMRPITELLTAYDAIPLFTPKGKPRMDRTTLLQKTKRVKRRRSFSAAMREQPEEATTYALTDAVVTSRLAATLWPRIAADPRLLAAYQMEKALVPVLLQMEERGVLIDLAQLDRVEQQLTTMGQAAELELYTRLNDGIPFNLNAPRQVGPRLRQANFPLDATTPTGQLSVDRTALLDSMGLASEDEISRDTEAGRILAALLGYRQATKLQNTFVAALRGGRDAAGRVHARFNQSTATSRLSSSHPNLQNIPARTALGRTIRMAFRAPFGFTIVKADFSQLELRVFAHYSGEPALVEAYTTGQDVHTRTAAELYHVAPEQVTAAQRKTAKNVNFLMLYGGSALRLAHTGGVPLAEAEALLARVHERMPSYAAWPKQVARWLGRDGYVETLFGFRNSYPGFFSPLPWEKRKAIREAANMPIQGTASGLCKQLMIDVDRRIRDAGQDIHLVLQVHDEVVYEVPDPLVAEFAGLLEDAARRLGDRYLRVPLVIECSAGASWGETAPLETGSPGLP